MRYHGRAKPYFAQKKENIQSRTLEGLSKPGTRLRLRDLLSIVVPCTTSKESRDTLTT